MIGKFVTNKDQTSKGVKLRILQTSQLLTSWAKVHWLVRMVLERKKIKYFI